MIDLVGLASTFILVAWKYLLICEHSGTLHISRVNFHMGF